MKDTDTPMFITRSTQEMYERYLREQELLRRDPSYFNAIVFDEPIRPLADLDKPMTDIHRQFMVELVDMADRCVVNTIIDAAREAGVTHLYLIDKKFVVDAIQEKLERMNDDERRY